jgi:superfamily II DNA or RNA helicase
MDFEIRPCPCVAVPDYDAIIDSVFGDTRLARQLWPHQERALAAFDAQAGQSAYLVVPPGGGKTLIGLEAARRLGRPTVVLCPNTAIQAQWMGQWRTEFMPQPVPATASRDLPTPLTVLTYQAVCTLGNGNGNGNDAKAVPWHAPDSAALLSILHPNGQRLISELAARGPWTLVLDECHHLLEIWGRVLKAVIEQLDRPQVIGLTATPPHMMTAEQARLHAELFSAVNFEVTAPALVRDGHLAPYQELAYFTTPTAAEADYIHTEAVRFAELRTDLLDPQFATTPFLSWLQARVVERRTDPGGAQVSWQRFERDEPALADATLRLHAAGLLPLPEGARLREQHRHPPAAEDWVVLIGDYSRRCLLASDDPRDITAYEAIRRALPSVGYRLTRAGVRAGESPVDRVLARSESKARAVSEILRAESAEIGSRLRALVLCDFEEAGGTLPARLAGIMDHEAGGARLALQTLLADESTAALDPVLLTGRRVACGPETARRLLDWMRAAEPELKLELAAGGQMASGGGAPVASGSDAPVALEHADLVVSSPGGLVAEITGPTGWEPRHYVPLVTRFFAEGGSRCLVGTRALLGEGWDAPAVNVVVDLTAATTPTSVVQARGRALRLDDGWPGKVANNWAVVCVTDEHPKGAADYGRFARKHDRYFALSRAGDVISGVAHVDPRLSPYQPPPPGQLDTLNAEMLTRSAERDAVRERWAIGSAYADESVATVTVATARPLGLAHRTAPRAVPSAHAGQTALRWRLGLSLMAVLVAVASLAIKPAVLAAVAAAVVVAAAIMIARTAARVVTAPLSGSLEDLAMATADALHTAGRVSRGGAAVRVEVLPDGAYRARLQDVPAGESAVFATALDEVLSPLAQPRYIVPRLIVTPPSGTRAALGLAVRRVLGGPVPAALVYHAVPSVLGANKQLAAVFTQAWNARVSPGELVYTGTPEGAGILQVQRGDDPFAVTTQIRTLWR